VAAVDMAAVVAAAADTAVVVAAVVDTAAAEVAADTAAAEAAVVTIKIINFFRYQIFKSFPFLWKGFFL
jgi:hypothetical protein